MTKCLTAIYITVRCNGKTDTYMGIIAIKHCSTMPLVCGPAGPTPAGINPAGTAPAGVDPAGQFPAGLISHRMAVYHEFLIGNQSADDGGGDCVGDSRQKSTT